jgi:hypothetical protein
MKRILFTLVAGLYVGRAVYKGLRTNQLGQPASTPEIWEA